MIGIYKITNPLGEIYIGQSMDVEGRFNYYKRYHAPQQPRLNTSFFTHGVQKHTFEIICEATLEYINALETYFIEFYNSHLQLNTKHEKSIKPKLIKTKKQRQDEFSDYLKKQLNKQKQKNTVSQMAIEKQIIAPVISKSNHPSIITDPIQKYLKDRFFNNVKLINKGKINNNDVIVINGKYSLIKYTKYNK